MEQSDEFGTVDPEDAAWLESVAPLLLRDEYPDQMAARSCTCEPDATCGAHRLLARYDALYQHMAGLNAERRDLRQRLREAQEEVARLREEMRVVAAGLDVLIMGGCDQAKNLVRLRDHLAAESGSYGTDNTEEKEHG